MKPVLHLDFCDLGDRYEKESHFLLPMLRTRFDVRLSDGPDLVIHGAAGNHHRLYTCPRVFLTDEAIRPDFGASDYALTCFPPDDARSYRLPCYVRFTDPAALLRTPGDGAAAAAAAAKTEFCSFLVSYGHRKARRRIEFFERLSRYKKVDSGGRVLNNIGGPLPPGREAKLTFLRRHKFALCFENALHPGYVTEKLADALEARCIPIYWGAPEAAQDFNPRSFINVSDFPSDDHAVAHVVRMDNDPALYRAMLEEPCFPGNVPPSPFDPAPLCDFFARILADPRPPAGRRGARALFRNWNRWVLVKRNRV